MKASIPEFSLLEIVKSALHVQDENIDYFVASFASPMQLTTFPQRASYFGVAVCTQGNAKLLADLESYSLLPGSLIVMGPQTIRSWRDQSADYAEETLFFTESFFSAHSGHINPLGVFSFFQDNATKVIKLDKTDKNIICDNLQTIKNTSTTSSLRKDEMVRSYINITLNHVADLYDKYDPNRLAKVNSQFNMVGEFKKLLIEKHLELRTVNGYADLLNVTPKHLSETIKEATGKTAREWIHDILILEAKVRLKQTSLSVTVIAESLNFSDPSLFGKYFRRYTGHSPLAYRKHWDHHDKTIVNLFDKEVSKKI